LAELNNKRIEEEKRQYLKKSELAILQNEHRLSFDWGGLLNYRYDDYNEDDNDSSIRDFYNYTNSVDVRLWFRAVLAAPPEASKENKHSLYVRIKDLYIDRRPEDTAGGADHDGPHLDYAFLTLDYRPAWIIAGRYYFSAGDGIAYSDVHDGLAFFFYPEDWQLKTFLSFSQPNEYNIDTSIPGYEDNSRRFFSGAELTYRGAENHQLYTYLVIQRDNSKEEPEDPDHDYDYNSEYLGFGAKGKLVDIFRFKAELIYETGKSRIYSSGVKSDINARAADLKVFYDLETYSEPVIYAEYAFGSGDSERASVTDAQGGNLSGKDNNFLYFGYIDTGYALAPQLSNLHFFRIGFSFKPFKQYKLFRQGELKLDYFKFYKDKKSGGIYDPDATEAFRDIGDEIDAAFIWQVFSDLNITLQYGHFIPGKAYAAPANDNEDYFSLSTNITF